MRVALVLAMTVLLGCAAKSGTIHASDVTQTSDGAVWFTEVRRMSRMVDGHEVTKNETFLVRCSQTPRLVCIRHATQEMRTGGR